METFLMSTRLKLWPLAVMLIRVASVTEIVSIHDVHREAVVDEMVYTVEEQTSLPPEVPSPHITNDRQSGVPRVPSYTRPMPDEQRLLQYLFHGYERTVRPVSNASTPVIIRMGLTLTQIFDMDEKDQVLVTNVWLDQEWEDEFMRWDPEQFANITTLRIPCFKLWLPDIVLYNNAAEYTDGVMPANAMVSYDGNVFWPVPTKLQSSCKVDVTYFPFDEQICYMKFGSWTYDGFQVDITNRTEEVDLSNYVNNGEWELLDVKIIRNVVFYTCCKEPFPDVTFTIHIRRRTLYYMYNVIFPCIMMSALTLLVFCLPPDSGEKIALGITVLLAFSVFMLAVAENLPETSEFVPLISIYLTIVMALTSMSVIMTVFVLNLHHRGPNKRAVPTWLKSLLHSVSPYLFLRENIPDSQRYYNHEERMVKNVSLKITLDNIQQALQNETQLEANDRNARGNSVSRVSSVNTESDVPQINIDTGSNNIMNTSQQQVDNQNLTGLNAHVQHQHYCHYNPQTSQFTSQTGVHLNPNIIDTNANQSSSLSSSPCRNGNNKRTKRRSNTQVSKTNEEILKSLKRILEKHEKEDRDYEVIQDWRRVAQCVDRILFFIFLLATFFSTVGILVIAPATQ